VSTTLDVSSVWNSALANNMNSSEAVSAKFKQINSTVKSLVFDMVQLDSINQNVLSYYSNQNREKKEAEIAAQVQAARTSTDSDQTDTSTSESSSSSETSEASETATKESKKSTSYFLSQAVNWQRAYMAMQTLSLENTTTGSTGYDLIGNYINRKA